MRLQDMEAKLPADQFWHPKPCCQKRTPIFGVRFWQLGLRYQIRTGGNLAPIFGGRTKLLHTKHEQTHLLMFVHPKIGAEPIFRSLAQHQI